MKAHLVVEALVSRERHDEVRGDGAAEHVELRGVRVRVARAPHVEAPPAERDAEIIARHYAPLRATPVRHTDSTVNYFQTNSNDPKYRFRQRKFGNLIAVYDL